MWIINFWEKGTANPSFGGFVRLNSDEEKDAFIEQYKPIFKMKVE